MKLFHKFFLSFSGMLILVLFLNLCTQYFIARHNFTELAGKVENKRAMDLINQLSFAYSSHNNWDFIKNNPLEWIKYTGFPSEHKKGKIHGFSPPHGSFTNMMKKKRKRRFKRLAAPFDIRQRLALFDADNIQIAGVKADSDDFKKFDIIYDLKKIGWVGIKKLTQNEKPKFMNFFRQLKTTFLITSLISVVFAGCFAFFLSRHLITPLKEIVKGTSLLKKRDFKIRIDVKTNDELGKLASDFNVMANTLEEFETQRNQWLSDISHELRTPVSILQGEIEAIIDGIRKPDKESLNGIHNEVIHLKKLINDLHDLFLAESGKLKINPTDIDLFEIIECDASLYSYLYNKRNITIETDLEEVRTTIKADQQRLHQVFKNLFENTLRYTDSPGELKISGKKENDHLIILFEDSKPGVSEDSINHIFQRLYREDKARTRAMGGSGLGLAICQKIIEEHNGKIFAYQSPLGGLGIQIGFPLNGVKNE